MLDDLTIFHCMHSTMRNDSITSNITVQDHPEVASGTGVGKTI